ncbi:MAG: molecular chaperone DnaJ [Deltaproteobacteria bacterium RBG_13_49_15]|nr:MAG: molecular chaperone DnaJ [Deltaproteobacteria bacterium RBG_13_49_15]
MLNGYDKIVEERIKKAMSEGEFNNLPGSGKPLNLEDDRFVPEDLRLAYKILKNADCIPPEIELKKEIAKTEDLLAGMKDTAEKYGTLKKLNFLIMKLNSMRKSTIELDMPQQYTGKLVDRLSSGKEGKKDKSKANAVRFHL